jgi:hypothetical protein
LFNCVGGSAVITGNVRPAIDPSEVKIYLEPPSQYEIIGIVEASSDVEFSSQAAQDRVMTELKKQAAKIGANGVLLINVGNQAGGMTGFYSGGVFYAGSSETKTAHGQAIYIIQRIDGEVKMELVENQLENSLYNIYVPRHYFIKTKYLQGNAGIRYYLCSNEGNNENIHGILYFGIDQNEHKIRFDEKTIIENIETTVLNEKIIWPIYYTEENYFTVITIDYKTETLYQLIRIEGKENSKEKLINLINIFSTLRKNDNTYDEKID